MDPPTYPFEETSFMNGPLGTVHKLCHLGGGGGQCSYLDIPISPKRVKKSDDSGNLTLAQ